MLIFTLLTVTLALFLLLFIASGIKVYKEWERVAVFRLGKYYGIRGPGIIFKMPILDKVSPIISLKEQVETINIGNAKTADGTSRRITGVVGWRPVDIERMVLAVEDYRTAASSLVDHRIRVMTESLSEHTIITNPEEYSQTVLTDLEDALSEWGIKVVRVELRAESSWE